VELICWPLFWPRLSIEIITNAANNSLAWHGRNKKARLAAGLDLVSVWCGLEHFRLLVLVSKKTGINRLLRFGRD
jgi:hypothetical protein